MADVGNGVTIAVAGFTANVTEITFPWGSRDAVDTSHLGTVDFKSFMPGALVDPGEIEVTYQYDGATANGPPITATAATVTVVVPAPPGSTTTNTLTYSAFVQDAGGISVTNDDLMEGTMTLKVTGAYTHA